SYCIVSRDYANNSNVFYNSGFNFFVSKTLINILLIISTSLVVATIGISIFILFNNILKFSRLVKDIEERI
ncbi:MAG: hypothetical protein ACFFC3_16790, partial [Candidatus Odinarchaeota archaeon]